MPESNFEHEPDMMPWAAYVIGHHRSTLHLWHEMAWYDLKYNSPDLASQSWEPVTTAIQELNEAMRILAVGGHVKPAVLVELHRALDEFEIIYRDMFESSEVDGETTPPGYRELCIIGDLSWHLLEAPDELRAWHRLGNEVGLKQFLLKSGADGEAGHDPDRAQKIQELLRGLPGRDPIIKAIKASLAKEPMTVREALDLFLDFCHSDNQLRAKLAHRLAPDQVLVLDRDRLKLFGETRALATIPQSEVACLWVLAEQAGRPVSRQDIIREGRISTDENNLKSIVSRLRNYLKKIVSASCRRKGCAKPKGFADGFIRGEREKRYGVGHYGRGPYTLDLEPGRVRVQGPRPNWMKSQ